jgi:TolA-binding protein
MRWVAGLLALALSAPSVLLAAQARVTLVVNDESGTPVPGAIVTVTTPNMSSFSKTVTTDAKGRIEIVLIDASWNYNFRAEKKDLSPTLVSLKLPGGGNQNLTMTLHPPVAPPQAPVPRVDPGVTAYNEGVGLLQSGKNVEARKKFEEAVAARPELASAWRALAQIAYEKKDYAGALSSGRKALAKDPKQTDLYGILADAAQQTKDPAAAEYKKKYLELNADNPDVLYNSGVEAFNTGDYRLAAQNFARAVQIKRNMAAAYFWLAMSEYNLKKYAEARATFQRYLDMAPKGDQAANAREMLKAIPK